MATGGLSKPEGSRRQEALREYIEKATAARKTAALSHPRRQKPSTQYAITLGKMQYSDVRGRGILIRSFTAQRAHFNPDCDYATVLQEVKRLVFGEAQEGVHYYLADGSGLPVCGKNGLVKICNADHTTSNLNWTLRTHIEISGTYPSKLRLYCVEKVEDRASESDSSGSETAAHTPSREKRAHVDVSKTSSLSPALTHGTYSSDTPTSGTDVSFLSCAPCKASASFVVMFAHPILRKYATGPERYAFSTGVNQCEALAHRLKDEDDLMLECRETLDEGASGGMERILEANPLSHGFFLSSLYTGLDSECYDFIERYDMITGDISYATPRDDAEFATWTGYKVSQQDWAALLVCVAVNGYHGIAIYTWQKDGEDLSDEKYPLLYTKSVGKYHCIISIPTVPVKATKDFEVKEKNDILFVTEGPAHIFHLLNTSVTEEPKKQMEQQDIMGEGDVTCTASLQLLTHVLKDNISTEDCSKLSIVREIGRGSFGVVYLAKWRGAVVAVKQIPLPSGQCIEALKEVQTLREIQHPNILTILGVEVLPEKVSIITNFVQGSSLHTLIFDMAHPRPPEQLTAKRFDWGVDVYAFAGVIVELFGERSLWESLLPFQIICKVVTDGEVPPYEHIDSRLHLICRKGFAPRSERLPMHNVLHMLLSLL